MSRKLIRFVLSLVLLSAVAGNALAVTVIWDGDGDDLWSTAINWDADTVPTANDDVQNPLSNTTMLIDSTVAAVVNSLKIGVNTGSSGLNMTGGTLTTTQSIHIGQDGGTNKAGKGSTFNLSGGTVTSNSNLFIGVFGSGTLHMAGGMFNINGLLSLNETDSTANEGRFGHLQLDGGTITCATLAVKMSGSIDITKGTLILSSCPNNSSPSVSSSSRGGASLAGLINDSFITAFGGSGVVLVNTDINPGKFTLTASPPDLNLAGNPSPGDGATVIQQQVKAGLTLSWRTGEFAAEVNGQDVYFGTSFNNVKKASRVNRLGVYQGNQTEPRFVPDHVELGKTYYWRIDNVDKSDQNSPLKGEVWSFKTVGRGSDVLTFFFVADTHYGVSPGSIPRNQANIDRMNSLPGTEYPATVTGGGVVQTPLGVLAGGDLTNRATEAEWKSFVKDYGVNGEGRINYPVYEGYGNHERLGHDDALNGIISRNTQRAVALNISANGLHYSWDWNQVHFVNLNYYPGGDGIALNSLAFLTADLSTNVGDSGRPVVLYQHLGYGDFSGLAWTKAERDAYYRVIKDYNVIGIFGGHEHRTYHQTWQGMDFYGVRLGLRGVFLVVHIAEDAMIVAEHNSKGNWGSIWQKSIVFPPVCVHSLTGEKR